MSEFLEKGKNLIKSLSDKLPSKKQVADSITDYIKEKWVYDYGNHVPKTFEEIKQFLYDHWDDFINDKFETWCKLSDSDEALEKTIERYLDEGFSRPDISKMLSVEFPHYVQQNKRLGFVVGQIIYAKEHK